MKEDELDSLGLRPWGTKDAMKTEAQRFTEPGLRQRSVSHCGAKLQRISSDNCLRRIPRYPQGLIWLISASWP
jgi:hypothetical protein